jgi:hypothetical protein
LAHHRDDNSIRDKTALGHVLLSLLTKGRAFADLLAKQIASGNVVVVIVADQLLGDSTLAATGGTYEVEKEKST